MVDLRVSRDRSDSAIAAITPQLEIFNLANAATEVGFNPNVGSSYLRPTEILSPRLLRLGVTIDF